MNRRTFLWQTAATTSLVTAACSTKPTVEYAAHPVSAEEHAATIAAMKPPKRARPLVAVLCDNPGSETTDLIIPWSILSRSGVADVEIVSTEPGPVRLVPALRINAHMTTAEFEASWPDGPDYVIVPAFHHPKSPRAVDWIKRMAGSGASIVSICAGALTVGHAGLFEGRAATTHWYSVDDLRKISPNMTWKQDRRYVADNGVISTTGVSASIPVSLALVEAIAGTERANELAAELGVAAFDETHDSAAYANANGYIGRAIVNAGNLLGKETHAIEVADNIDELTLAVTADAWSRTYRSSCVTLGDKPMITTKHGLQVIVDRTNPRGLNLLPTLPAKPGSGIDTALAGIHQRYGLPTAAFVALQLEHPWPPGIELVSQQGV